MATLYTTLDDGSLLFPPSGATYTVTSGRIENVSADDRPHLLNLDGVSKDDPRAAPEVEEPVLVAPAQETPPAPQAAWFPTPADNGPHESV